MVDAPFRPFPSGDAAAHGAARSAACAVPQTVVQHPPVHLGQGGRCHVFVSRSHLGETRHEVMPRANLEDGAVNTSFWQVFGLTIRKASLGPNDYDVETDDHYER